MDLKHSFTVPASIQETWDAFNDIESVAQCFPGATVTSVEGDTFQGTVKVKLGPIALVYNGTGSFTEKDEAAHRMVIDAKGKDKRGNGTAGAGVTATMTEVADGTQVDVVTDLSITGKPAQFGRGVIQDVSDKLLGQFVDCLKSKVGSAGASPEAEASTPAGAPPETASGATSSATGTPAAATAEPGTAESQPAPAASRPAPQPAAQASPKQDDALDLGATVLPVIAKAYWKQALAAVVAIVVVVVIIKKLV